MREKKIDIRELRATLETRLGNSELAARLQKMLESGQASWSGKRLPNIIPRVPLQGRKTLSELLLEDRE